MNYKQLKINGVPIYEHRHVMELHLGRKLLPDEIVHHKDRDRRNNNINNLELTTHSQHAKDHHKRNELHKIDYNNSWRHRYNHGKRVLVKNVHGKELFTSLLVIVPSGAGLKINGLWTGCLQLLINGIDFFEKKFGSIYEH